MVVDARLRWRKKNLFGSLQFKAEKIVWLGDYISRGHMCPRVYRVENRLNR